MQEIVDQQCSTLGCCPNSGCMEMFCLILIYKDTLLHLVVGSAVAIQTNRFTRRRKNTGKLPVPVVLNLN